MKLNLSVEILVEKLKPENIIKRYYMVKSDSYDEIIQRYNIDKSNSSYQDVVRNAAHSTSN